MMNDKKISRQIKILMIISILPVLAGTLLYFFHEHFQFQFKTINHGTLVNPPLAVKGLVNEKKWRIIYSPAHCCDKQCDNMMFTLHQLHKAFNKDVKRVSLVLVAGQNCKIKELHDFQKLLSNKNIFITRDKIYLVDPMGNLFMYYPVTVNPIDILKDLKRVLEVSQIG